jgi:hypothetical protein
MREEYQGRRRRFLRMCCCDNLLTMLGQGGKLHSCCLDRMYSVNLILSAESHEAQPWPGIPEIPRCPCFRIRKASSNT